MGIVVIVAWFAILVAAFFFLVVRPQRRNVQAHQALVAALEVGDRIITSGGIHGTVRGLAEDSLDVEIASGVTVTVARGAIAQLRVDGPDARPSGATD